MNDIKNTVSPYNFKCKSFTPILPAVYSEALSYMEALAQYCAKLNEVIDALNEFSTEVLTEANAYTDSKVNAQTQFVENAVRDLSNLANTLETQFENLVSIVGEDIDAIRAEITADIEAVNNRTDLRIQQNNEWILEHMSEELAQIKVRNYFTGELISVQDMFDYLAQFHLENSLTYNQLYAKSKTYTELLNLHITYTQLVTNGNVIIT